MKRGISQEGLKLLACVTMLVDHVAALHYAVTPLRVIGRLSFPIFCFLLSEGVYHTRNPRKYALRLLVVALLSELPFDYALFGGIDWWHQSVMVTLLLGFCAVQSAKMVTSFWLKLVSAAPFLIIAHFANADYGVNGVALIILFGLTREWPLRPLIQALGMLLIFSGSGGRVLFEVMGQPVVLQMAAVLAMIPIALYSGEKRSSSKLLQWTFYLFYPVHLVVLILFK